MTIREPLALTQASIALKLNNLRLSETYEILAGLWTREREEIIARRKAKPDAAGFDELAGFDRAASLISRWADKASESKEEKPWQSPTQENE